MEGVEGMSFADNLKKAREMKDISQAQLANAVGVSQPTIAQYEKGLKLPTVITAADIARRLGTTCEELVRNDGMV